MHVLYYNCNNYSDGKSHSESNFTIRNYICSFNDCTVVYRISDLCIIDNNKEKLFNYDDVIYQCNKFNDSDNIYIFFNHQIRDSLHNFYINDNKFNEFNKIHFGDNTYYISHENNTRPFIYFKYNNATFMFC